MAVSSVLLVVVTDLDSGIRYGQWDGRNGFSCFGTAYLGGPLTFLVAYCMSYAT